jgi:hypothetical protein
VQYAWPPHDPTRLPDVVRNPQASPFVYGDGFNPNLRPSNRDARQRPQGRHSNRHHVAFEQGELRSRDGRRVEGWRPSGGGPDGDIYSSGSDRDGDSGSNTSRSRSSPEPYLSDYDEEGWGPAERTGKFGRTTVREGSEGLEVRAVGGWAAQMDLDRDQGGHQGSTSHGDHFAHEPERRPWESQGRYNVYVPQGGYVETSTNWSDDER